MLTKCPVYLKTQTECNHFINLSKIAFFFSNMLLYPAQLVEGCGISTLPNVPEESDGAPGCSSGMVMYSSLMARLCLVCIERWASVSRMASAVGVCDNCGSLSLAPAGEPCLARPPAGSG